MTTTNRPLSLTTPIAATPTQRVSLQMVTPSQAAEWLETMPYEHQRSVRQQWVDYLVEEAKRGQFKQGTQIEIAYHSGKPMLIDGQHRLWAVITSGMPQLFAVLEVSVESKSEAAWRYSTTDIGLKRTASDMFAALELTDELGLTKTQINAMSAAVSFMHGGCTRHANRSMRLHRDDVVKGLRLYAPYMREFFAAITKVHQLGHAIHRASTISLVMLTMRFSAPRAAEQSMPAAMDFWTATILDDGLRVSDPRKFANRHLLTTSMPGGGKGPNPVHPAYSIRYLGFCFNAYMEGREMFQPKVYNQDTPLAVWGVPRDHTKWFE